LAAVALLFLRIVVARSTWFLVVLIRIRGINSALWIHWAPEFDFGLNIWTFRKNPRLVNERQRNSALIGKTISFFVLVESEGPLEFRPPEATSDLFASFLA